MVLPTVEQKTCEVLTLLFRLFHLFLSLSNSTKLDVIEYACTVLGKYEVISKISRQGNEFLYHLTRSKPHLQL